MKVKSILAAIALAVSSASSFAVTALIPVVPDTFYIALGPVDSYSFSLSSGPVYSLSSSVAVLANTVTGIELDTDSIFGGGISFIQNGNAWSLLPQFPVAGGDYFINIAGSPSASALISVTASGTLPAVPEPETYALMLAGLGAIGFVATRRRSN